MLKKWIIFLYVFGLLNVLAANDSVKFVLPDTFNIENPDHYINYAAQLINQGKLDEGKIVIDLGLQMGEKGKNDYLLSNLNYFLADYYYYQQKYDSAHRLYYQVLPSFEAQNDTLMIAKTLNSIGLMFSFEQDQEQTLKYYLLEVELLNKVKKRTYKLDIEKMVMLTNIINLYSDIKEHQEVVDLSKQAIALAHELNDSLRLGSVLNSLALAQKNLGEIDQSLATFQEASRLFRSMNDEFRNSFIINNIGGIYELDNRNLDSAYYYYSSALNGFQQNDYQWGIAQAKLGVASVLSKQKKYHDAERNYNDIIDISKEFRFNQVLAFAYQGLAQMEYERGNYKKAFELKGIYDELNDSLFNEEKHKQLAELETKYKIVQKENEINHLKNEKLSQELLLERANLQRLIGLITVLFLLTIIYVFFIYYNQKRRDNQLLTEKNKQIEMQNEKLKTMNEHIQTINKTLQISKHELTLANNSKNKFFSILAHDLRNPFHNILGQSYLLSKTYDKLNKEERKQYADEVYASCEQVNRLLDNLLEWSRTQSKGVEFRPQKFDLKDIISNTLALLQKNAEKKSIAIINNANPEIQLIADKQMMETIVRNIVNNGIKFTPEGGSIQLDATIGKNKLRLIITDNGVGIEKKNLKKLFKIHSNFKTKGTNDERGTGLGLVICQEFVGFHKGKIWVESEVGVGSKFFVELPLTQKI